MERTVKWEMGNGKTWNASPPVSQNFTYFDPNLTCVFEILSPDSARATHLFEIRNCSTRGVCNYHIFCIDEKFNFLIFLAISNKPQRVTVGRCCTIFSPGFGKRDDIKDKRPIALSARTSSIETAQRTSMFLAYSICQSRYSVPPSISREQLGIIGNIRLY